MTELKHQPQQWPVSRPTRLATMRPPSGPLIILPPSPDTKEDKGMPTWRQTDGEERLTQTEP
jgi:hypothetical protein